MDAACRAGAGDVDCGTAFSECASNPFADTVTASCDNCYQLIVPAHFCLLASIVLIGTAENCGRVLAEQLFGLIEFCLTPTSNNNISHRPSLGWLLTLQGDRTSHIYAEATNDARHWASRDTTSSGTRTNNTLSHDACSSRPLSSLSPVFAASV